MKSAREVKENLEQGVRSIKTTPKTPLIHILLIEDNPGDATLLKASLRQGFDESALQVETAETLQEGLQLLKTKEFDLVTVDLNLPDSTGLDAVQRVRTEKPDIPVVVLTGWADREFALNALRIGAQDYLIKGSFDPESLRWSINCAVARQKTLNEMDGFRKDEMERNELKDRVLSMTAHDIRGSIVGVLGFLRNILEGEFIDNLSPEQRRVFELMLKNCEDVISLSDEIVQARRVKSKAFQTELESVNIGEFLTEVVDRCRDKAILKSIRIHINFTGAPTEFLFDPKLVSRALKNLIINAIKFSPESSNVEVVAAEDENSSLYFSVKDKGPGIPQSQLSSIFDELSPLKLGSIPLSNGLGLVIVKRIAEAHRGSAWVESELGRGSTFGIRLPETKSEKPC